MATGIEVLGMLLPDGGWIITGNDYEGIQFLECEPITKKQLSEKQLLMKLHKFRQV